MPPMSPGTRLIEARSAMQTRASRNPASRLPAALMPQSSTFAPPMLTTSMRNTAGLDAISAAMAVARSFNVSKALMVHLRVGQVASLPESENPVEIHGRPAQPTQALRLGRRPGKEGQHRPACLDHLPGRGDVRERGQILHAGGVTQ